MEKKQNNTEPLISVVVPAYNHEKYIAECIESILSQTYQNLELLVTDDGSKDRTWEVLCALKPKCEKRFKRVVFKTQQNQGSSTTFYQLFLAAQGKYIILCASDDKFAPEAVEKLSAFLEVHPKTQLAVGKNLIMDGESRVCYWDKNKNNIYDKNKARYLSFTDFVEEGSHIDRHSEQYGTYETLARGNYITNGWMFRQSSLSKMIPFSKETPLEDWWLMLQISKISPIKAIDDVTFYYRWHGANTISQRKKMRQMACKTILEEERTLKEKGDTEHLEMLRKVCYRRKTVLNLGFLKIYLDIAPNEKKKILQIFGWKIKLQTKKYV